MRDDCKVVVHLSEPAHGVGDVAACGLHVAQNAGGAVGDIVYAAEYVVERGNGIVDEVYRLARNVGEIVRGAAHVAGDGVEPVRDVGGGVARVQEPYLTLDLSAEAAERSSVR